MSWWWYLYIATASARVTLFRYAGLNSRDVRWSSVSLRAASASASLPALEPRLAPRPPRFRRAGDLLRPVRALAPRLPRRLDPALVRRCACLPSCLCRRAMRFRHLDRASVMWVKALNNTMPRSASPRCPRSGPCQSFVANTTPTLAPMPKPTMRMSLAMAPGKPPSPHSPAWTFWSISDCTQLARYSLVNAFVSSHVVPGCPGKVGYRNRVPLSTCVSGCRSSMRSDWVSNRPGSTSTSTGRPWRYSRSTSSSCKPRFWAAAWAAARPTGVDTRPLSSPPDTPTPLPADGGAPRRCGTAAGANGDVARRACDGDMSPSSKPNAEACPGVPGASRRGGLPGCWAWPERKG